MNYTRACCQIQCLRNAELLHRKGHEEKENIQFIFIVKEKHFTKCPEQLNKNLSVTSVKVIQFLYVQLANVQKYIMH